MVGLALDKHKALKECAWAHGYGATPSKIGFMSGD